MRYFRVKGFKKKAAPVAAHRNQKSILVPQSEARTAQLLYICVVQSGAQKPPNPIHLAHRSRQGPAEVLVHHHTCAAGPHALVGFG